VSRGLNALGVQFDSRFKTRIKVGVSVAGHPTLKARFRAPAQAVAGVVTGGVTTTGSVPSGIVAKAVTGLTLDMLSGGLEASQRSTKGQSPKVTQAKILIVK